MIKTALSASLIPFAVLAPAASAADRDDMRAAPLDDKAAKCAELRGPVKFDKKTGLEIANRLPKEALEKMKALGCDAVELEPEPCPPPAEQWAKDRRVRALMASGAAVSPAALPEGYRPECAIELPAESEKYATSGAGSSVRHMP